jgi:hypothetical protein
VADGRAFTEAIVSSLGTPQEPFGVGEILVLLVLAAAVAGNFALEYAAGRIIARLFGRLRARARGDRTSGGSAEGRPDQEPPAR